MKKIFSPIIILSLFLTLISFGCRNAVYPQSESKGLGYVGALFFWSETTGNCVTTARLVNTPVKALYPSSVVGLPLAVCVDRNIYYIGDGDTGGTHPIADAAAAAANAELDKLIGEYLRVAGLSAGAEAGCSRSADFFAWVKLVTQSGAAVFAQAGAGTFAKCKSLTTGNKGMSIVYCQTTAEQAKFVDSFRYNVISDVKTEVAFKTQYDTFVAALTAAKATNGFTAAALANVTTIDIAFAETMSQTLQGNAYTYAHFAAGVLDAGNAAAEEACASWFVRNNDEVKKQVARTSGIKETAPSTYDISLNYVQQNVVSPVVYDIYLSGTNIVGQGLLCCRDGAVVGVCAGSLTQVVGVPTAAACGGSTNIPALW